MASIVIMIAGALINATAFTGGNYLAQYLSGGGKAALEEKTCPLEKYQEAMANYKRERTQLLDWIETNREIKEQAKQNLSEAEH